MEFRNRRVNSDQVVLKAGQVYGVLTYQAQ